MTHIIILTCTKGKVPAYCIKKGLKLGCPERLKLRCPERFSELEPLSLIEQAVISPIRLFSHCIQLVAPRGLGRNARQKAVQGHVIAVPHDGPVKAAAELPRTEDIVDILHVVFLGSKDAWAKYNNNNKQQQQKQQLHQQQEIITTTNDSNNNKNNKYKQQRLATNNNNKRLQQQPTTTTTNNYHNSQQQQQQQQQTTTNNNNNNNNNNNKQQQQQE